MAACGWAEITGLPGVAYATSGPGATNLLTGIACAYFESLPAVFITGQVNTYEQKGELKVRQRGFQETDIVSIAKPVTKLAMMVSDASELPAALELAFRTAMAAVQYHLLDIRLSEDGYQRNDLASIRQAGFAGGSPPAVAVSYTHLDVYKRQPHRPDTFWGSQAFQIH